MGQPGRDPFGLLLADRDDIGAELAAALLFRAIRLVHIPDHAAGHETGPGWSWSTGTPSGTRPWSLRELSERLDRAAELAATPDSGCVVPGKRARDALTAAWARVTIALIRGG